jgi:hypothetical protein
MSENGNGRAVSDNYLRWIVGGVMVLAMGLASLLWNQSMAQISELKTQVGALSVVVSDMKADTKLLTARQQEISDKLSELSGSLNPSLNSKKPMR